MSMNSTVQFGEDLRDFSPTELSSAWDVGVPGDLETVIPGVKQDVEAGGENWTTPRPPYSPAAAAPAPENNYSSALKSKRTFSDILRRVKVREDVLQGTIARLGGGTQGLQLLMEYVNYWALTSPDDDDAVTVTISRGIANLGMPPTPNRHHPKPRVSTTDETGGGNATARPRESVDYGAAHTRALRKSHLERQRGHKRVHQRRHSTMSNYGNLSQQLRPSANHRSSKVDMEFEPCIQNGKGYDFLFQKVLRASDVSSLGRIVLPKKDAERYFPFLVAKEGIMISLEDYHCGKFWVARYRYWPNNKSRMYLLENIGEFVSFHCLKERDLLLCYRNDRGGYVIQGQKLQSVGKSPSRGLIARSAPAFETELATPATPTACQFVEESACGTYEEDVANTFFDSSSFTSDEASDARGSSEDRISRVRGGFSEQTSHPTCDEEVPETSYPACDEEVPGNGFMASDKPLVQDWDLDPVVAMLSVGNVRQRYMEDMQFLGDCTGIA